MSSKSQGNQSQEPLSRSVTNSPAAVAVGRPMFTPGPWVPFYIPSQGWAACWQGPKTNGGFGPDQNLYPICHMRWTDGMRPDIEARLEVECLLIAAAPDLREASSKALRTFETMALRGERTPVSLIKEAVDALRAALALATKPVSVTPEAD